ncbi:peptidase M48 [Wenxinia marina]|uniref:Zn-dependent protease with chaperone function n=1 Tax=Wenxinia marina DSM 24838 TaxID=1123501 RepID=A0A0D0PZP9_9RHOB|nr:Zn-dependent protease with chaperone function [Wenxinia marina DSM 24838]GGL74623.1 peptidase M48 [Wenxinia marina]
MGVLKFLPILLAIGYGIAVYRFSAWRTARELDEKSTELADPRLLAATRKLAEALDLPRIKVNLYEIDAVNGLAAPDGRIFLTRGFYDKFRSGAVSAEEMASVIAHELGHVALGHTKRRMIDFSGQNAVRTALALLLNRVLPGIGGYLATGLVSLVAAKMSRGDEYEADAYATALMMKAGLGAGPQKSMFRKLEGLSGGRGGATPAWLLSHPRTDERIKAIEENEAKWLAG